MCNMGVFPFRLIQGLGLGLRLGQGLELRHDNSFVHIRRIGIRRNGAEL